MSEQFSNKPKPAEEYILNNYDAGGKELKNIINNAFKSIRYSLSLKQSLEVKAQIIENQVNVIYNSDKVETVKYFSDAERNKVLELINTLRSGLDAWETSGGKSEHQNNVKKNFTALVSELCLYGTSKGALDRYDVTNAHTIIIDTIKSLEKL
jgi:hypothetical protein